MDRSITNIEMGALLKSLLKDGRSCRFKVKGSSMRPLIREGDLVTVKPAILRQIRIGDVVAHVDAETGRFLLHRVVDKSRVECALVTKGDSCIDVDGVKTDSGVIGRVVKVERLGRRVFFGMGPERGIVARLSRLGCVNKVARIKMYGRNFLRYAMLIAMLTVLSSSGQAKPEEGKGKAKSKKAPLVVLKQAKIKGKVFFLINDGDEDLIAENLLIEVRTEDDKLSLFKTATDKNGEFVLPNLDVGTYRLAVGLLVVELQVEDIKKEDMKKNVQAKNIVVFIPSAMNKKAKR